MKKICLIYPKKIGMIAPEIYGHFTEHLGGVIYDGLWVGKDSSVPNIRGFRKEIVEKLKAIHAPVLRWPGGCFAETYDWRDGIGKERPIRLNWWTGSDGRYESNEVGTHEFMDLCEMTGAKPYFAANLTSVTPLHIRNWMDYCLSPKGSTTLAKEREENGHPEPFDIPYCGVGNENWGGGGNMLPETYANEYRKFAIVMNNIAPKVDLIACGTNGKDYDWAHGLMPILFTSDKNNASKCINGFAIHCYCGGAGDVLNFTEEEWTQLLIQANEIEAVILRNWHIICGHNMEEHCKLVIDEWGCWHPEGSGPSKGDNLFEQQGTMRDAMVAALTLNIFNRNCDKVKMANIAQLVNCLHSLFLVSGEKCIETPTYHVFDLYQGHQGAKAIDTFVTDNEEFASSVSVSASCKDGKTLVTIGNLSCNEDVEISLDGMGIELPDTGTARILAHEDMHAHNTFENPDEVVPVTMTFDPRKPFTVPKAGIAALTF